MESLSFFFEIASFLTTFLIIVASSYYLYIAFRSIASGSLKIRNELIRRDTEILAKQKSFILNYRRLQEKSTFRANTARSRVLWEL